MGKSANAMTVKDQYYWIFLLPQFPIQLGIALLLILSFKTFTFCLSWIFALVFILKYYIKILFTLINIFWYPLNFVPEVSASLTAL